MPDHPIISGWTIRRLLQSDPGDVELSLDLGVSTETIQRTQTDVLLPNTTAVPLSGLKDLNSDPEDCFLLLAEETIRKVYLYSDETRKYYKLYQPEENVAPTIVIAGATMHTIVDNTPWDDAHQKTSALPPRNGECLDTCFGLGYSAQLLRNRGYEKIVSCEKDSNVLRIARLNPWSANAFDRDGIEVVPSDVREYISDCQNERFAGIFHDPPTIHQAGELYSGELYKDFQRIMKSGGVFYHYVGSPGKKRGQDFKRGVMRRLQDAGFTRVERRKGGVTGQKR